MPAHAATRRLGIMVPSVNTITERELHQAAPSHVQVHLERIPVLATDTSSDNSTIALLNEVLSGLDESLGRMNAIRPDYIVLGMSAPVFQGGYATGQHFLTGLDARSNAPVGAAADSLVTALGELNCGRIGVLSPYQRVNDAALERYFTEAGLEVVGIESTRSANAHDIAAIDRDDLLARARRLADEGVEAIIQVGANLGIAELIEPTERWLGLPVLSLNLTGLWGALRRLNDHTQLPHLGRLWREH